MQGYSTFTSDANTNCSKGKDCCMNMGESTTTNLNSLGDPADPTKEFIFPPELSCKSELWNGQSLLFKSPSMTWYRPSTLNDFLRLKSIHPNAKIVVGNTELGIEMKFKKMSYPIMIQPNQITELTQLNVTDKGLLVGASVTLTQLEDKMKNLLENYPKFATQTYQQIIEMLRWFAGKQIRNVGSIGGNIMTGSPISDLNPIFMAARCILKISSLSKDNEISRNVTFDQHFYTGYRKTLLSPNEILISILIPFNEKDDHFIAFKQARRRDDDIAIVNGAFSFKVDSKNVIACSRMAFGGLAPMTKMSIKTSKFMTGKIWCPSTFERAMEVLLEEFSLSSNVPGGMVRYRQTLALSLFFKAFLTISDTAKLYPLNPEDKSITTIFHKEPTQGTQIFEIPIGNESEVDPIKKPLKHASAEKQATGEAIYVDDIPRIKDEKYLAFVLSTKSHAKIENIDASHVLGLKGVIAFFCHKDIDLPNNQYTMVLEPDECLFADEYVYCVGQIIGVVVASDQETANKAAYQVSVQYTTVEPIITIEDAISKESYFSHFGTSIKSTNCIESDLEESDVVISGQFRSGAQEHFYMEPQCCIAIPTEGDEMLIYAATQSPYEAQRLAAHVLNVPMNKVITRVKRLGGGFGGKETRCMPLIMAAAFAASKTGMPVRVCLDRDQDMLMCGHRHPFLTKYSVGCTKEGKLKALEAKVYNNAGYSLDLSFAVLHR